MGSKALESSGVGLTDAKRQEEAKELGVKVSGTTPDISPKRNKMSDTWIEDTWPVCAKCDRTLWKKSFPDDSFYYEPCPQCEPQPKQGDISVIDKDRVCIAGKWYVAVDNETDPYPKREEIAVWKPIETMPQGEIGFCTADHRSNGEICVNDADGEYIRMQGYKYWFPVPRNNLIEVQNT